MKINFYVGFNNYYNRKVIVHNSLDDYKDYLLLSIPNVNFKLKDGINTEQIVNTTQTVDYQVFNLSNTPDYAIVADDDNTIISRWFVIEYESLIYKNQYKAVLRRDVIADNFDAVIEAPVFIEKATITDKNDPAIFNNENMGFNQIKAGEGYIKDKSECPWIVGYLPTNFDPSYENNSHTLRFKTNDGTTYEVVNMSKGNRVNLDSAPYAMFCIPYSDALKIYYTDLNTPKFTASKSIALALAQQIAKEVGADSVFDMQLLPFCPLQNKLSRINGEPAFNYNNIVSNRIDLITIGSSGTETRTENVARIYWCPTNQFSFSVNANVTGLEIWLTEPLTALEAKIRNETKMFRLCSPNYQGQFEFNPMKNHGVDFFEIDCTYQPINPYIHVVPKFKTFTVYNTNLYGKDFDDARGLICGGDFSLPQETSAWANYQQNNKNFQASFDRQIQNMETMNKYQMISQVASSTVGALQGAGTGAFIGSGMALGGPNGAAIGAGISGVGGIIDSIMLSAQQKETLDYTKDQFGYQMGNIKAMPNSVSKSSPFTNNNKIFPVLEFYRCTTQEEEALIEKLKYNGMTIGRIGKIKDWLLDDYSYIKGKLIMLDSIEEDYHTVVEIAQELDKGIRAKKEA